MAQSLATHLSDSMATFINNGNNRASEESNRTPCSGQQMKKEQDSNVRVALHNKEMWDKFHLVGTEMIITKAGRCICLYLSYSAFIYAFVFILFVLPFCYSFTMPYAVTTRVQRNL